LSESEQALADILRIVSEYRDAVKNLRVNVVGFLAALRGTEDVLTKIIEGEKPNGN
jgi:hypothetical protein